jgi:hypothetical protein
MFSLISPRVYVFIAICTAATLYVIGLLDSGGTIAAFIRSQELIAARSGLGAAIASFVGEPLALAFSDPLWAIIAGIAWPAGVIWFVLFCAMMVFAFIAPSMGLAVDSFS